MRWNVKQIEAARFICKYFLNNPSERERDKTLILIYLSFSFLVLGNFKTLSVSSVQLPFIEVA